MMVKNMIVSTTAAMSLLLVGCVGMGVTVSPADGRVSLDFDARDCITDNIAGRTISAIPVIGDWAMLNWGCDETGELIGASGE
jgi:hypothetical protein